MNSSDTPIVSETQGILPDLQTKIASSVSGFVTDQNNAPVVGAEVTAGSTTVVTDRYGYFEIKNVQVVKEAATVTVNYTGYFKAVKTYLATEGKAAFFRIKLLQKTIIGTVEATAGGNVSISNGMNIFFPANAIKNANGNIYNGTVNVAAQYLDPTSPELNNTMPGDLRGINNDGYIKGLTSFGMMGVELTGTSGEILQIADGKKSTITMPVPASITSSAPATIPLWHFDESNGLWKEEGTATKTGNTYIGEVGHFSWWNCDFPNAIVPLTFTIVNENNLPVKNAYVEIVTNPTSAGYIHGYTDSTGFLSSFVPANKSYSITVYGNGCGTDLPAYSANFNVQNEAIDLGNIALPAASMAQISGTISDCNNQPVSNGILLIRSGSINTYYPVNNGTYDVSLPVCNQNLEIIGIDFTTAQQSVPATNNIQPGVNQPINLQACGISMQTYVNYSVNGVLYNNFSLLSQYVIGFMHGAFCDSCWMHTQVSSPASGSFTFENLELDFANPTVTEFATSSIPGIATPTSFSPLPLHFTEWGPVNSYISGNFGGVLTATTAPYQVFNITVNFRLQRYQ